MDEADARGAWLRAIFPAALAAGAACLIGACSSDGAASSAEDAATLDGDAAGDASHASDGSDASDAGGAADVGQDDVADTLVDAPPPDGSPWKLVWSDEFDGPDGSAVDPKRWSFETGGNGWGNQELETYTSRTENAHVQAGALWITARKETFKGADGITRDYTSARLVSKGLFEHAYGRYEANIQIPRGQGIWPAFWMLGNDIGAKGWPTCGEIDIMENIGREPTIVHGTIHGPGYSGGAGISAPDSLPSKAPFADAFHVYAVEWTPTSIAFSVDGAVYATRVPADLPSGAKWVYDHPFFLLLNVAVGGGWPGAPDATTSFPQIMKVDWVRVYDRI
jgi:beta-glucanase (GH16 family)